MRARRVVVLGGGVAGLTAAHELAERGFAVEVYERRDRIGGKARSFDAPGTAQPGRAGLPAEHGFRFFPGFYRHLDDTMRRTPSGQRVGASVLDHLIPTTRTVFLGVDERPMPVATRPPDGAREWVQATTKFLAALAEPGHGAKSTDVVRHQRTLARLLTSCEARRLTLEDVAWWDYAQAESLPADFADLWCDRIMRCLVAVRGREMSARAAGTILLQLVLDMVRPGATSDRVLDGPTSEVWLNPWRRHLEALGVRFHQAEVTQLVLEGQRLASVLARPVGGGTPTPVVGDEFVCALPLEGLLPLVSPALARAEPILGRLSRLRTSWMNGVMYYLDRPLSFEHGHLTCFRSPWALTVVTHGQFWPRFDWAASGQGAARDVLSVDLSDWDTPGLLHAKPAKACTRDEILAEVWHQLRMHLTREQAAALDAARVVGTCIDPSITFGPDGTVSGNEEPLLVNTVGSWHHRPPARLRVENLVLAGDYARTITNLACMEGANEAARRAVNEVLDATGSAAPRCAVFAIPEPAAVEPLKALDAWRFQRGLPHVLDPADGPDARGSRGRGAVHARAEP